MPSHRVLIVIGGVAVALGAPPAASAAPSPGAPKVTEAKHADGPYHSVAPRVNLSPGEATSVYIKVRNTTGHRQGVTLTDDSFPSPNDYRVDWFDGDKDVTNRVDGSGYDFKLKHGKSNRFRLHIKAKGSAEPACIGGRFHALPDDAYGWGYFALNDDPDAICSG